jgi:hypothetical protein
VRIPRPEGAVEEFAVAAAATGVASALLAYFAGPEIGMFPTGVGAGLWLAGGWLWLREAVAA